MIENKLIYVHIGRESSHREVVSEEDCDIVGNEFELQSFYYVLVQTNTVENGRNFLFTQLWVK